MGGSRGRQGFWPHPTSCTSLENHKCLKYWYGPPLEPFEPIGSNCFSRGVRTAFVDDRKKLSGPPQPHTQRNILELVNKVLASCILLVGKWHFYLEDQLRNWTSTFNYNLCVNVCLKRNVKQKIHDCIIRNPEGEQSNDPLKNRNNPLPLRLLLSSAPVLAKIYEPRSICSQRSISYYWLYMNRSKYPIIWCGFSLVCTPLWPKSTSN